MPERPSFLSEKDIVNLRESGQKLMAAFVADYPESLPSAVIYPETSARPLFYLFDPFLTKLAEERGVPKPLSFFFKVCASRRDLSTAISYERLTGEDMVVKTTKMKEEFELLRQQRETGQIDPWVWSKEVDRYCTWSKNVTDDVLLLRGAVQKRADKIQRHLRKTGRPPTFAIIDDFVSDGSCLYEIRRALGDSQIPAYAFASHCLPNAWKESQPLRAAGTSYFNNGLLIDWGHNDKNGHDGSKTRVLGVVKQGEPANPYALRTEGENRDAVRMAQLRKELCELGRELASPF